MITSLLILMFSLVLFIYWFRYTCQLILKAGQGYVCAVAVAGGNRLNFAQVREELRNPSEGVILDPLHQSLDKDYMMLQYLFQHAAGFGMPPLERRLLDLDYRLMQVWYRATRHSSASQARRALAEMSDIVLYLARRLGERSASYSQA